VGVENPDLGLQESQRERARDRSIAVASFIPPAIIYYVQSVRQTTREAVRSCSGVSEFIRMGIVYTGWSHRDHVREIDGGNEMEN
jgi:hypothetical protein